MKQNVIGNKSKGNIARTNCLNDIAFLRQAYNSNFIAFLSLLGLIIANLLCEFSIVYHKINLFARHIVIKKIM